MLEQIRKGLVDGATQIAVITLQRRHWLEAKTFVWQVLGQPKSKTERIWMYDGKVVHFFVEPTFDAPLIRGRGFAGTVLHFGPGECDELHGISRG